MALEEAVLGQIAGAVASGVAACGAQHWHRGDRSAAERRRAPPSTAEHRRDEHGAQLATWQNAPSSPTTTVTDAYDGEGNRVVQRVTSGGGSTTTTTDYVVGGLMEQVVGGGTPTSYYTVPGVVTAISVNGALSYLASDGLGSVTAALSSASAVLAASQLFGPYGSLRYQSGVMPTARGFTGQYADAATGLDYYNARYYDPLAGQFISADPARDGLNLYAYVRDNPETLTDPTGLVTGGICGGGFAGVPGLGGFAQACIVVGFDQNAGWSGAVTLTGGGPANTGLGGAGLDLGGQVSTAETVDDLGGYFAYGGVGGSLGPVGGYGTGFGGKGTHGQNVGGLDLGWQDGFDFDIHAGASYTKVIPITDLPLVIAKASTGAIAKASTGVHRVALQLGKTGAKAAQQWGRAKAWASQRMRGAAAWFAEQLQRTTSWLGQQIRVAKAWVGQQVGAAQAWIGQGLGDVRHWFGS